MRNPALKYLRWNIQIKNPLVVMCFIDYIFYFKCKNITFMFWWSTGVSMCVGKVPSEHCKIRKTPLSYRYTVC